LQFLFADYVLDVDLRELRRGSALVAAEPQVFDLLSYLLENRDRIVSKDDLIASVWRGRIVSDSTLDSRINAARRAIGDNGEEQRLIRTVARRGIRFVGDVCTRSAGEDTAGPAPEESRAFVRSGLPHPDGRAIAVLPFVNMSGEPEQEYFSDGISEDIITAISRLRWFVVISRTSSFAFKGRSVPMKHIAEELGVGYLVEGSVRKSGDRVRITAQLNDAATGSQLWAERYDRNLSDIFAVQDEITDSIVAAIEPQLYAAEHFRARRRAPENLDAWHLVMRALAHFWRVTVGDNAMAQELLEQAIATDPNCAQALAVLAVSHIFGARMGWEDVAAATTAAERAAFAAFRADSEDPWAHLALGCTYPYLGRVEDALAAFESALRLNPNFSLAQGCYGLVLSWCGRWREGAEAARRALRLSPRDPFSAIYYGIAGYAAFVERDYDEAIRLSREGIRQRADFVGGYRVLTAAAAMAGDLDLARTTLQGLRRVQPNISLAWATSQLPLKAEDERQHFLEALRRAGLE
jgi:TolB-like protein/Tfp pilus assembly protein PilF